MWGECEQAARILVRMRYHELLSVDDITIVLGEVVVVHSEVEPV